VAGAVIIFLFLMVALAAPVLAPYAPYGEMTIEESLLPPGRQHLLGTDSLGRDVLSRIIYGARVSLAVGVVVELISLGVGVPLGLIAGYFGGVADDMISGLMNLLFAFPGLLLAIAIMAVLGPSLFNVFLALGLVGWPPVARVVRGETLAYKEREFVEASKAAGGSSLRVLVRHILPNCTGPLIVLATLGAADAILSEASLSFLGLGVQPPIPSWGAMLSRGRDYIYTAPWLTVSPGIAIFVTILGLNLFGDALRDALDPRLRV
jgi:ABC-type dipeptide/oligopeptide/nickel transport system permease subunit